MTSVPIAIFAAPRHQRSLAVSPHAQQLTPLSTELPLSTNHARLSVGSYERRSSSDHVQAWPVPLRNGPNSYREPPAHGHGSLALLHAYFRPACATFFVDH